MLSWIHSGWGWFKVKILRPGLILSQRLDLNKLSDCGRCNCCEMNQTVVAAVVGFIIEMAALVVLFLMTPIQFFLCP